MLQFLYRLCVETLVIYRECVFSGNVLITYLECASLGQFITDKSGKLIEHLERNQAETDSFFIFS